MINRNTSNSLVARIRGRNEYTTFGSIMEGRSYERDTSLGYRYAFNGKETDHESDLQDYGFRIFNLLSIGQFLSIDPLTSIYPELSPYQFAENSPIWASDLDGLEAKKSNEVKSYGKTIGLNYHADQDNLDASKIQSQVNLKAEMSARMAVPKPTQPPKLGQGGLLGNDEAERTMMIQKFIIENTTPIPTVIKLAEGQKVTAFEIGLESLSMLPMGKIAGKLLSTTFKSGGKIITSGITHGTTLHWNTIVNSGAKLAEKGSTVFLNKTINTALGKTIDVVGKWKPDVLSIGKNGSILLQEVISPSQVKNIAALRQKLVDMQGALIKAGYKDVKVQLLTESGKLVK